MALSATDREAQSLQMGMAIFRDTISRKYRYLRVNRDVVDCYLGEVVATSLICHHLPIRAFAPTIEAALACKP